MTNHFLTSLGNEVRKGLLHAWSERLQILIELPIMATLIVMLGPLLGQGHQIAAGHVRWSLDPHRTAVLVVWYIPFVYFYMQIIKLFWRLLGEIQSGTIEQVYLSPLPSWLVTAAGRVVAALIETIVVSAAIFGIVRALVPLPMHWSVAALVPLALLTVSATGVSLMIAGATLVWKRIQMVNETVLLLIFVFSAAAVPLIAVPGWWSAAARFTPLNNGVASLYQTMFLTRSLAGQWSDGVLAWLAGTAAAYLGAGILAFRLGERTAKRRGTLGRY
jgi:ABC-type polysaccharide/polyol phosphate export permease